MESYKVNNELIWNLQRAKRALETWGEHMGTGEMFRLRRIVNDNLPNYRKDGNIKGREIHDAVHGSVEDYLRIYGTSKRSAPFRKLNLYKHQ